VAITVEPEDGDDFESPDRTRISPLALDSPGAVPSTSTPLVPVALDPDIISTSPPRIGKLPAALPPETRMAAPEPVTEVPAFTSIPPASAEPSPLLIDTAPLSRDALVPIFIDPLDPDGASPLIKLMRPPAMPASLVPPDASVRSPPEPDVLLPAVTDTAPPDPEPAAPELTFTEPVLPPAAEPLPKVTSPLEPFSPPLSLTTRVAPLRPPSLEPPLLTVVEPPSPDVETPPESNKPPPSARSELPARTLTDPPFI